MGQQLGTTYYMAPEQLRAEKLDGRADQWALAVTAYRMLTGQRPFDGATESIIETSILENEPSRSPLLDDETDRAIRRSLSKEPSKRFGTCTEFVEAMYTQLLRRRKRAAELLVAAEHARLDEAWSLAAEARALDPESPEIEQLSVNIDSRQKRRVELVNEIGDAIAMTEHAGDIIPAHMFPPRLIEMEVELEKALRPAKAGGYPSIAIATTTSANITKLGKDGLIYVWVPPGHFLVGAEPRDPFFDQDEQPRRPTAITGGFWIGQTPVTQAAYQRVMGNNPSYFRGDSLPVEAVSWGEAQAYCLAVGGRLPTEAEWEWAARARITSPMYDYLDRIAWYDFNSGRPAGVHDPKQ
jgi:formylglycine-generating enzyme required for sulfatase activity